MNRHPIHASKTVESPSFALRLLANEFCNVGRRQVRSQPLQEVLELCARETALLGRRVQDNVRRGGVREVPRRIKWICANFARVHPKSGTLPAALGMLYAESVRTIRGTERSSVISRAYARESLGSTRNGDGLGI